MSKKRSTRKHVGKLDKGLRRTREKKRYLRRRATRRDREAASALGKHVEVSTGGILVASSAPPPLAYLRIRRNGTGAIAKSLGVESFLSKHLAQVLTHGTRDLDMRLHHVDDSEVEAAKRAAGVDLP